MISALNTLWIEDPSLSFSINSYSDELEDEYSFSEPILILDYIPGIDLRSKIREKVFTDEFGKVQVNRIIKLCRKILAFLKVLEEKGYGVVGLSDAD